MVCERDGSCYESSALHLTFATDPREPVILPSS